MPLISDRIPTIVVMVLCDSIDAGGASHSAG